MENVILVNKLVKCYRKAKVNAVDEISFDVKKGELFALLGPNGAGKTTTISILTTTLSKTSGNVEIAGFDIESQSSSVRKNIGVIFQNPSLDLNLTAEENIRFHAVLYGLYSYKPTYSLMPHTYKKRVNELAKIIGIEKEIFSPVKTFSGGMKRKLEIIRSLMHRPKILYLDEPTSGLDPNSRKNLWSYLAHVRESEKTTILLTTHYLEEAEDADRVAIIDKGKIIAVGTPDKIKKDLISEFLLIDAKDRQKLLNELDGLKIKYEVGKRIKISTNMKNSHKVLKEIKTDLNFLKMHSPTLEEAYIKLINQNGQS